LPEGIPITLQGGEPFIYRGIWDILENVRHKMDILTALPPQVTVERLKKLKTLDWNKRGAPYPTIRVSFHKGQNDYKDLIHRIKELREFLSIGLFHINHPAYTDVIDEIREYAQKHGVEFRTKPFLGEYEGKLYAPYKYTDACVGKVIRANVKCRNTVFPVGPDGSVYRCHSDLYARRFDEIIGNLLDEDLDLSHKYRDCAYYGTCSPCDVKIKTNHLQEDGYTSVDIIFENEEALQKNTRH